MKSNLREGINLYLETRRRFGFVLAQPARELGSFIRYAERLGHAGPLTTSLALQWAQAPKECTRSYWAVRLEILRRFAQFWRAYDPRTEIPPQGFFGPAYARRPVHIFTPQELGALFEAACDVGRIHPLRGWTFCTLVALLNCTGLRIGEALALSDQDIDWPGATLTVRQSKNGHSRLVPVQACTLAALDRYRILRQKAIGPGAAPRFFVTYRGKAVGYFGVNAVFRKLCRDLGWMHPPVPRLHDFRHTFAVRTLLGWYRSGEVINSKLWSLSTYLGHRHLSDTYWYLTAVPELMQLCQERFATAQTWASGGTAHE